MKLFFISFPFLLLSCADRTVTQIPIVPVRFPDEAATALTTTLPKPPASLEVSMASLPNQIRQGNLSLAAARKLVAEAHGKLQRSGVASNPELEIEFDTDHRLGDFMLTVGFSKKYPRTNRLFLEKRASAILIQAARAEVRDAERLLIGQARTALVSVLALRQHRALISAQEANAHELTKFTELAAARGEASVLDAGIALLEATRLSNQAKQIEIKEILATAKLKPLLGMKPQGKLTVTGSLATPEMPAQNVTTYRRPDVEAARLRARNAAAESDLAHSQKLDDIEAGVFAGIGRERDEPDGFDANGLVGFRIKIPLGDNPAAIGRIAESRARQQRFELGARALVHSVNAEAHASYAEMNQWQLLAEQIKTKLLPLAQNQINQTEAARTAGQAALRDVLLAKEQKLSLETSYLEAVRDFHLAYANYLTATAQ